MKPYFILVLFFKGGFGLIGFLTWQNNTDEVITNNLPTKELKLIVNLILVVKALLSYPLPYYASVDLIESSFFQTNQTRKEKSKYLFPSCYDEEYELKFWAVCLRISLILFTLLLAIFIPHFALLMVILTLFTFCKIFKKFKILGFNW